VVIVVTRYFGGTLLGTGGLVHAYTAAAIGALENAEIIRYDIYSSAEFEISYSDYGKISTVLSEVGFRIADTVFEENVKISGSILSSNFESLSEKMTEITSGRVEIRLLGEKFEY
jgi:putative IMPACT (imprinted ancient) family translation regulator